MRPAWWYGPGRYLMLGAALFALILHHSWTDAWLGDFWVHLPAVKELAERPLDPRDPLFAGDSPSAFLSPYALLLGLASRLSRLRPIEVLILQGLVNVALLLGALYAFVAAWLGRRSAAFYALLFLLFLWGREPWRFSGFLHLRSLVFVAPYPSTFAVAVALGGLALARRLTRSGGLAWAGLAVPVLAVLWIVHPVNALFLCAGLGVLGIEAARPLRHWAALAPAVALAVGLAFAWPLYPVPQLWFAEAGSVHAGNDAMYDDPLRRVAPALLGAPWLLVRLRRSPRDPLALLALGLALLVSYGAASGAWSYGRLIAHLVLLLHVALADAAAALEERLARLRAGTVLRRLLAPSLAAILAAGSWSSLQATLEESGRGDPLWLEFLERHVGRDDVVLADLATCWYVPSFAGKVVAYPMRLPFVRDHDRRLGTVTRFFGPGVPLRERLDVIRRHQVAYILLAKGHFSDWQALAGELRPLGRVVYTSPEHELLRTVPGQAGRRSVSGPGDE